LLRHQTVLAAAGTASTANLRFGRNHKHITATDQFDVAAVWLPSEARRLEGLLICRLDARPVDVSLSNAALYGNTHGHPD
jgi:hypothetical protein